MELVIGKKRIELKTILEKIIDIACILCLTYTIVFSCDMGNELYQSLKNIAAAKALFMLTLFFFLIQRVRLFNWQSLVVSLVYWPIGYFYKMQYSMAPDLYNHDKVVAWIIWLVLLILTDMIVYKKVNPLSKFNNTALFIFSGMTIFMIFFRNGRTYPIILVLAFLFYLVPMNKEKWKRIINYFCFSWLLAFFIIFYRSMKNNPGLHDNGRWYGDFLNIGDFGLFMACTITVVLFQLYLTKKESGIKNIKFPFYLLCLFPIVWTILRVNTLTLFIGIGCIFFMCFILLNKDTSLKSVIFRLVSLSLALAILCIAGFMLLKLLSNADYDYWMDILRNGNPLLKPVANLVKRAHYMFAEPRTFADCGIFEPTSVINYLDLFTSGRLSIIKMFSDQFSFTGNGSAGIQVGSYFAYTAHNTYAQIIYEYGYIGGGFFIVWLIYSTVASAGQYIREKKHTLLLPCVWMAMTLGVLLGESINLYMPIMIMTLILTYPLMVHIDDTPEITSEN